MCTYPYKFFKIIFIIIILLVPLFSHGGIINDLREKISNFSNEIGKLEEEINEYKEQVDQIGKQAETLENAIKTLNITDKKLSTDIRITEKKTSTATLTIETLEIEITDKKDKIKKNSLALSEVIRKIYELESRSLVEIILANNSFSAFWGNIVDLGRFQIGVRDNLEKLQELKLELENNKNLSIKERRNFLALSTRLVDQKKIVKENTLNKNRLLKDTKNEELIYRDLLEERLAKKEALEQEIRDFEEQLRIEIDPDSLPETGTGVLRWPLDAVKITQYFGNTPFASRNPQVYNGKGHNGIDLRSSIGTIVHSSAGGEVIGVADTDKQCYGASYGKWVLIRHNNGLSTLYAHLSLIRVNIGDKVEMGDVIGYSGNTGYSTGPHLHFAVFVSKAVHVTSKYKSRVCGTYLTLPLSAQNGYLNPLSYLPLRQ